MIDKIISTFEKENANPIYVFKLKELKSADNGYGVFFDLPEYAVIYKNDINISKTIYDLEFELEINILKFYDGIFTTDRLIEQLKSDGYIKVWEIK